MSVAIEGWWKLVCRAGLDRFFPRSDQARQAVLKGVQQRFDKAAQLLSISPVDLWEQLNRLNVPWRDAFLQALVVESVSPQGLVVVWHLLHGHRLVQARLQYRRRECFQFEVELQGPHQQRQIFALDHPNDARLLAHFDLFWYDDKPVWGQFNPFPFWRVASQ